MLAAAQPEVGRLTPGAATGGVMPTPGTEGTGTVGSLTVGIEIGGLTGGPVTGGAGGPGGPVTGGVDGKTSAGGAGDAVAP
jgi:hypothetical protein